jgi:hypothetical protein
MESNRKTTQRFKFKKRRGEMNLMEQMICSACGNDKHFQLIFILDESQIYCLRCMKSKTEVLTSEEKKVI